MMPKEAELHIAIAIELQHAVPWHHDTYEGVMQYGKEQGWFCHIDPLLTGPAGQGELTSYDGVVGRLTGELPELVVQHEVHAVSLMSRLTPSEPHSVSIDSFTGGQMIAEHLVTSGYRVFGQLLEQDPASPWRMTKGMQEALQSHGFNHLASCELPDLIESSRQSAATNRRIIADWIKSTPKPIGVMLQNITVARYLAQTCLELGLRIPEDVGIAVHDGDEVVVNHGSPTLTSLEHDFFKQGYEAAALLNDLMLGGPCEPRHRLIKPKRIIVRESTDVFLCDDPIVANAMRFIAENVRRHLTIEEVADHLNIAERTLRRRFEDTLGKTVFSEIKRLRIDYVKRLLLETDRSISSIAEDCGFSSTSHFARYFKTDCGISPSAFRKADQPDQA